MFVREAMIFWFCGLSGAGKSTVAEAVCNRLTADGRSVLMLDGDVVRENFHKTLGFSAADIAENNALIAKLCIKGADRHDVVIVPIISPLDPARKAARHEIGPGFRLVWCRSPVEVVAERDVKGLYALAAEGKIDDLIGYSKNGVAFEEPEDADLILDTVCEAPEESIDTFYRYVCDELRRRENEAGQEDEIRK